jgi:hypothetical protein
LASRSHLNSRPPPPPPGQQGRGSYVWVPDAAQDAEVEDQLVDEQLDAENLADDMAEEDNEGSAHTEEEYFDPHAAELEDFPGGDDVNEAGIGDDDAEKITCVVLF